MTFINDDGTDGTLFVWTIQNYSYFLHKPTEYLDSPSFVLDDNEADSWNMRLYPKGTLCSYILGYETIGLRLNHGRKSTSSRNVEFALSIRTTSGSFKKIKDLIHDFSINEHFGHPQFLKLEELRKKGAESYLDNDTMTLRCRIWKVDDKLLRHGQCYARTIINVERTTNIWQLEKDMIGKRYISPEKPPLVAMDLIYVIGDIIQLKIKPTNKDNPCFLTCDLSLLEAGGKVVHSMQREHWFDAEEVSPVWTFPGAIPLGEILKHGKAYLRCELAVSSGTEYSWVERVENGKVDQETLFDLKKEQDFDDSCKDDLKRLYSDGMFTDVIIRTTSKDFPVHKAILCTRSTVFHAMFELDMKENRTGVVNIEDVDAATVNKMLLFAYSDVVEDLDWDVATKLYFAADKYRITALRRRCSDFLKENLKVSNLCEVTVLADMHKDEDLKSFAQDFIVEHTAEVIRSEEWKRLLQDHVHIAAEMMNMLLLRNLYMFR